jgi:hypothetical protein
VFSPLVDPAVRSLDAVRQTLRANQALFELKSSFAPDGTLLSDGVEALLAQVPLMAEARVYEHCSAVSRMYAVYENYVEELISAWLDQVPRIWPNYLDVDEAVRARHRDGVATVLARLHHRRYGHLTEHDIAAGFARVFQPEPGYKLLREAFIHRDSNLRFEMLCKVLSGAGIQTVSGWRREGGGTLTSFFADTAEEGDTVSGLLDQLVVYRNDAAHGGADDILGVERLYFFCDFIECLVRDLGAHVGKHSIQALMDCGLATKVGRVTEVFPRANAVVATVEESAISVGDEFFLLTSSEARRARVESMMWHGARINGVSVSKPVEVGLKFDIVAGKCAIVRA